MSDRAVRLTDTFIQLAREELWSKLKDRKDHPFGTGLYRLSDKALLEQALLCLAETVQNAPPGKTGRPFFDDE